MFEHVFQWTVRNGSRALFFIAVLLILFGTLMNAWNILHESYSARDAVLAVIGGFVAALRSAVLPLVAAIAIEHFRARVSAGHTDI